MLTVASVTGSACDGHYGDRYQEARPVDSYLAHAARQPRGLSMSGLNGSPAGRKPRNPQQTKLTSDGKPLIGEDGKAGLAASLPLHRCDTIMVWL
jgi:hypothetical protein